MMRISLYVASQLKDAKKELTSPDKVDTTLMAPPQHLHQAGPLIHLAGGVVRVGDQDCANGMTICC